MCRHSIVYLCVIPENVIASTFFIVSRQEISTFNTKCTKIVSLFVFGSILSVWCTLQVRYLLKSFVFFCEKVMNQLVSPNPTQQRNHPIVPQTNGGKLTLFTTRSIYTSRPFPNFSTQIRYLLHVGSKIATIISDHEDSSAGYGL